MIKRIFYYFQIQKNWKKNLKPDIDRLTRAKSIERFSFLIRAGHKYTADEFNKLIS